METVLIVLGIAFLALLVVVGGIAFYHAITSTVDNISDKKE